MAPHSDSDLALAPAKSKKRCLSPSSYPIEAKYHFHNDIYYLNLSHLSVFNVSRGYEGKPICPCIDRTPHRKEFKERIETVSTEGGEKREGERVLKEEKKGKERRGRTALGMIETIMEQDMRRAKQEGCNCEDVKHLAGQPTPCMEASGIK
jgi:hypothetical protein